MDAELKQAEQRFANLWLALITRTQALAVTAQRTEVARTFEQIPALLALIEDIGAAMREIEALQKRERGRKLRRGR